MQTEKSDVRQEECYGSADVLIVCRTFWRRMKEKDVLDEGAASTNEIRSRVNRGPSGETRGSARSHASAGLTGASSAARVRSCPEDPVATRTAVAVVPVLTSRMRAKKGSRVLLLVDRPVLV